MAKTERSGHTTTDHDFIRGWVEERGGWPARVAGTGGRNDAGLIRIDFPGYSGEGSLERIEWEEWFQGFEENQLAFLHRDLDHGGGDLDRFNKLISRTGEEDGEGSAAASSRGRGGKTASGQDRGGKAASARGGSSRKSATADSNSSTGRGGSARKSADSGASTGRGASARKASADGSASTSRGGSSSRKSADTAAGGASTGRGGSARKSADTATGGASTGRGGSARKSADSGASAGRGASARKEGGNGRSRAASATAETGAKGRSAKSGAGADGATGGGELRELLLHELGDLLSAERVFLGTTKALAREAQDPEVRTRAEEHVRETEGQIERVKAAFGAVGERARAVTCEAALGLKEEHDSFKSDEKPSRLVLSAFGLGSGLRVEHYEIAAYRGAIELATALGEKECARILNESLREELAMASFLEKNARAVLKRMAAGGGAADGAGSGAAKSSGRGGSSVAAKKSAGSGSASGRKSGGSSGGGRARGGTRA